MVHFVSVAAPLFHTPPPGAELFPLTVQSVSVAVLLFHKPPPELA